MQPVRRKLNIGTPAEAAVAEVDPELKARIAAEAVESHKRELKAKAAESRARSKAKRLKEEADERAAAFQTAVHFASLRAKGDPKALEYLNSRSGFRHQEMLFSDKVALTPGMDADTFHRLMDEFDRDHTKFLQQSGISAPPLPTKKRNFIIQWLINFWRG